MPLRECKIELLEDEVDFFPCRDIDGILAIHVPDICRRVIVVRIVGWHYDSTNSRDVIATSTS